MTVGEYAWCSFIAADRALVRCEQEHAAVCTALLRNLPEVTASNRTAAYAAIGLIGPRAKELLMEIDLNPSGQIIQEALGCYEILLPAERGPELWEYLLEVRLAIRPGVRGPRRARSPRRGPPLRSALTPSQA